MGRQHRSFAHAVYRRNSQTVACPVGRSWLCVADCLRERGELVIGPRLLTKKRDCGTSGAGGHTLADRPATADREPAAVPVGWRVRTVTSLVGDEGAHRP